MCCLYLHHDNILCSLLMSMDVSSKLSPHLDYHYSCPVNCPLTSFTNVILNQLNIFSAPYKTALFNTLLPLNITMLQLKHLPPTTLPILNSLLKLRCQFTISKHSSILESFRLTLFFQLTPCQHI